MPWYSRPVAPISARCTAAASTIRANIIVGDARQFLVADHPPFDIVIVDLVDPYGEEGRALYREVIGLIKGVLASGAIVSSHGSSADPPGYVVLEVYALLQQYFSHLALHRAYIPSFAEEWGFLLASDAVDFERVTPTGLQERARRLSGPLRSIIPEQYPLAFRLPPALAEVQRQRQAGPPDAAAADEPEFRWIYQDGRGEEQENRRGEEQENRRGEEQESRRGEDVHLASPRPSTADAGARV